jgi:ankyrin repeat protein
MKKYAQKLFLTLILSICSMSMAGAMQSIGSDSALCNAQKNTYDKRLDSSMCKAAQKGDCEELRHLLDKNADPTARDKYGKTALIYASPWPENVEAMNVLLSNAAQRLDKAAYAAFINARDEDGVTALMYALARGNVKAVKILCDAALKIDESNYAVFITMRDNYGMTALIHASAHGGVEAKKVLLSKSAQRLDKVHYAAFVNAYDNHGMTALMRAAFFGHAEVVRTLLNAGSDVDLKDNEGNTAFDWARKKEHREVIQVFIEYFCPAYPLELIKDEIMPFVE